MSLAKGNSAQIARMAGGAFAVLAAISALFVAGCWQLNQMGLGGWLGWFNLAIFCAGWWLAWIWTRPGAVLAAPDWKLPAHFKDSDADMWDALRRGAESRSSELAAASTSTEVISVLREIWESINSAGPRWQDRTLAELVAALHAGQVRLANRAEEVLGRLLLPRIDRWQLVWRLGVLADRYGAVAWLPGLLLAPVDALCRWVTLKVARWPAERGLRRDLSRMLWTLALRDMGVVAIDFLAGRIAGPGARYAALVGNSESGSARPRLARPVVLAMLQGLPLIIILGSGLWYLASLSLLLPAVPLSFIGIGWVVFAGAAGHWLLPPPRAADMSRDAGGPIVERWIAELENEGLSASRSAADWLERIGKLDLEVGVAVSGSESGWRGRSIRELMGGMAELVHEVEELVRRAIPGSRHLRLGDWIAAGGWLGWLGRVTNTGSILTSAVPGKGGLAGMALSWLAGKVKRHADEALRSVMLRAAGRRLGNVLVRLHSGDWQEIEESANSGLSEIPKPVLLIVGSHGSGCTTLAGALAELESMREWEIIESHDWTDGTSKAGLPPEALRADALIVLMRAQGGARETEFAFIRRISEGNSSGGRAPFLLGVLSAGDLVPPTLEWNPPYDPAGGTSRKEMMLRTALEAARSGAGSLVNDWVIVGVRDGRWWGVSDGVVPWLDSTLERARGVRLARELESEITGSSWVEPARQAGRGLRGIAGFFLSGWKKASPSS
jgi:hypothetical protein